MRGSDTTKILKKGESVREIDIGQTLTRLDRFVENITTQTMRVHWLNKGQCIESTGLRGWLLGKLDTGYSTLLWLGHQSLRQLKGLFRLCHRLRDQSKFLPLLLQHPIETGGDLHPKNVRGIGRLYSCGKVRYNDKKSALTQKNFCHKYRGRHGRAMELRAYHCPDCQGWHLTKQIENV